MDINYYKKYEPLDGKWYFTRELGRGSFGAVFEVERRDFADMKSAMKVISIPASQSEVNSYREENYDLDEQSVTSYFYGFVEEFVEEFKLMSKLRGNSNIVSYEDHDVRKRDGEIGWDIFIRMELLTPMWQHFANGRPSREDVIKLGIDICKALEVCQKYHIIHRDIKPGNIFVSDTGDFKLGDFGVARTLERTTSGLSKKGTYVYMAPEIFRGSVYGPNVDIYSLGIVMYKLLNNNLEPLRHDRTHSDAEHALELRMQGCTLPKPVNADDRLAEIVLKACCFDPEHRYHDPAEMREDLESIRNVKSSFYLSRPTNQEVIQRKEIKETADDEKTVYMTVNMNPGQLSENDIIKLAMSHEPDDMESQKGRVFTERCLSKILPIYDAAQILSNVVRMNNPEDVKNLMEKATTDVLLVCYKTAEYYKNNGDDIAILSEFQKNLMEKLRMRKFDENGESEAPVNSSAAGTRNPSGVGKVISSLKGGFINRLK